MSKTTRSSEQNRKALLRRMSAHSRGRIIRRLVPFRNDDVPRYLRKLDEFERQSRKANLVVGLQPTSIAA